MSALSVVGASPRRRSALPSAEEDAARSTSLTVAPWRRPAARTPAKSTCAVATSRRALRVCCRLVAVPRCARASSAPAASRSGAPRSPRARSSARCAPPATVLCGEGSAGTQPRRGRAGRQGSGSPPSGAGPKSSRATSIAAMPSTSAWWAWPARAKPSASPRTRNIRQSGIVGARGWESSAPATSRRAAAPPGAGAETAWTCASRVKPGASSQLGPPSPSAGCTTRWRKRGTRCRRASRWRRSCASGGGLPAKRIVQPTCRGAVGVSSARKEASRALRRSGAAMLQGCQTPARRGTDPRSGEQRPSGRVGRRAG